MRRATISVTPTGGGTLTGDYGPGDRLVLGELTITVTRVRGASVTLRTSAAQDIAIGVGSSATLSGGAGVVTLDAIATGEE